MKAFDQPDVRLGEISDVVCRHYGVSEIDLRSRRRTKELVEPRHIALYLSRRLTTCSLPDIARYYGDRDHTTVLHAARKMDVQVKSCEKLCETALALEAAARALAQLRVAEFLPCAAEKPTAAQVAKAIRRGGRRAAINASIDHILMLCDAVIEAHEEQTDLPSLLNLARDFLTADADLQRRPTLLNREIRDRALQALTAAGPRASLGVDTIVIAHETLNAAQFTPGEKEAARRYRAAVDALRTKLLGKMHGNIEETAYGED